MKALIIGATGATGTDLVKQLLNDARFTSVHVFVRRILAFNHPKLVVHQVDFNHPESWSDLVRGDLAFSCLGTTLKAAGGKQQQWKIDYDYQYNFAKVAAENGVSTFLLISSQGADSKSNVFYTRMKGQLEQAISSLAFTSLIIFNPGLLERKDSDRFGEKLVSKILGFFNGFGILKRYKPLKTSLLAEKMREMSLLAPKGILHLHNRDIIG